METEMEFIEIEVSRNELEMIMKGLKLLQKKEGVFTEPEDKDSLSEIYKPILDYLNEIKTSNGFYNVTKKESEPDPFLFTENEPAN